MRTLYSGLNISFTVDGLPLRMIHVVTEALNRKIPSHSHGKGCFEIHYIPSGRGKALIDGNEYEIVPNTLFVTGPQVEHSQIPDEDDPMTEYCAYLTVPKSGEKRAGESGELFFNTPFWFGKNNYGIDLLFRRIFFELRGKRTGYLTEVQALFMQMIIALLRGYQRPDQTSPAVSINLNDTKSIILEEYFLYEYSNLSLEHLSDMLALSPRQTERLIHDLYGKTFRQKKAEARMSAAILLLSDPSRSISSVAEGLGYSSVEHFSTAFRRYYGVSASSYRNTGL